MTQFQKAVLLIASVAMLVAAWKLRYSITTVARGGDGSVAAAYQLDRFTGTVFLIWANRRLSVGDKESE